jgi:hypothetical protein
VNVPARLAAFGAGLAVLFAGGGLAGEVIGPDPPAAAAAATSGPGAQDSIPEEHTDMSASTSRHAAHDARGLTAAENGLRVVVDQPELRQGRREPLRFRILDEAGQTVRDFDVEHTKRMHLIIARRDLASFQHLHPDQQPDGRWTTEVRLADAGSYRLFVDFSHGQQPLTLATDLRVDGDADLRLLPASATTSVSDGGYDVALNADVADPGQETALRFSITRDGVPVPTEPYLGAGGHLVALRDGDLAFLHVHPTAAGPDDDAIGFAATFPSAGRYRLFLQFQHDGRVQTVAFTHEVS